MIAHQGCWVAEHDETEYHESKGDSEMVHGLPERYALTLFVDKNLHEGARYAVDAQNGPRHEHREEVSIIALANAVVDPDAVVVVPFDTVVAKPAVMRARGPPDIASSTMFYWNFHGSRTRF